MNEVNGGDRLNVFIELSASSSEPINQTVWALNAYSSKAVKAMNI